MYQLKQTTAIMLLILGFNCQLFSQQQAMFETIFYVEDAVGNIDSVIIGFDPSADYLFNPQFGEAHIAAPMDTILEARACHSDGMSWAPDFVFSKKIIGGAEKVAQWNCYVAEQMHIFVKAKHQPVTFYWNREDWSDYSACQRYSFMTSDNLVRLIDIDPFFDMGNRRGSCLSDTNQYTITLTGYAGAPDEYIVNLPPSITGDPDSLYGIMLFWFGADLPNDFCNQTVSSPELGYPDMSWGVFPNPATGGSITARFKGGTVPDRVVLRDGLGRVLSISDNENSAETVKIDTYQLRPGMYWAESWLGHRNLGTRKVIIMD